MNRRRLNELLAPAGAITDVPGIEVGHHTETRRPTGCSVVIARDGAVAGVDVRGAAPGTRETDLLSPTNTVQQVHAVLLAGGSAFGLAAATGVMQWLEENGIGFAIGRTRVPIVPGAVLFDLFAGDLSVRPDAAAGYAACAAARATAPAEGCVGAGTGAAVGKAFGLAHAMKGGIGTASVRVAGVTVGALIACNAVGDVVEPDTGLPIAGARSDDGRTLRDIRRSILRGDVPRPMLKQANTTIGVIATDAALDKAQANRLAQVAHDGLARAINPVHTASDGDALFALATGRAAEHPGLLVLAVMAAEAVALATARAVVMAQAFDHGGLKLPAAADMLTS